MRNVRPRRDMEQVPAPNPRGRPRGRPRGQARRNVPRNSQLPQPEQPQPEQPQPEQPQPEQPQPEQPQPEQPQPEQPQPEHQHEAGQVLLFDEREFDLHLNLFDDEGNILIILPDANPPVQPIINPPVIVQPVINPPVIIPPVIIPPVIIPPVINMPLLINPPINRVFNACPVCLEGAVARTFLCGHLFCNTCVDTLMGMSGRYGPPRCPTCRQEITHVITLFDV